MTNAKVGRPGKCQRICNACRKPCLPRDGDWFFTEENRDSQIFICKHCERKSSDYRRTIPIR